jgi:uncharacterized membrane protein HdeD (DUF308 family)
MLTMLARNWKWIALRGVLAIVFGVMTFAWPGITLLTLIYLYGAYALMDGIAAFAAAITGKGQETPLWYLILVGITGVGIGVITFAWPGVTGRILLLFIAIWAMVKGFFEVVAAIALRKEIQNEFFLALAGVLSILFGVVLVVRPGAGALGVLWLIGSFAIILGIVKIILAFRLKGLTKTLSVQQ